MWQFIKRYYHQLGSPKYFYQLSGRMLPWFVVFATLLLGVGWVWGLAFAPPDYQQGNSFRIIYMHVPAASVAMSIYAVMAVSGAIALIWKMKMAEVILQCSAPIGAIFTAIALLTGAIWGKPTWGTWWEWDARLTSMLVLFFLYLGVIALGGAIESRAASAKAVSVLAIVGAVNLPIIKFSVNWWNTLHQPATFKLTEKPAMPPEMWAPLLLCLVGTYCFYAGLLLFSSRTELLYRERHTRWVHSVLDGSNH